MTRTIELLLILVIFGLIIREVSYAHLYYISDGLDPALMIETNEATGE